MDKKTHKMNYYLDVVKTIELKSAITDGMNEKKATELKGTWVKLNPELFAFVEDANTTIVKITEDRGGCACDDFNNATTDRLCKHLIAFKDLKRTPSVTIQSPDHRSLQAYLFTLGWAADRDRWLLPHLDAPTEPEDAPELNEETSKNTTMVRYECPKCGDSVRIEFGKLQDWKLNHMDVCTGTKANESPKAPETSDPEIPDNSKQTQEAAPKKTDSDNPFFNSKYADSVCQKNPANKKAVVKDSLTTDAKTAQVAKPQKEENEMKSTSMKKTQTTAITKPVKKEMPSDAEFQTAAVGRIMKNQGSIYKIAGKEIAVRRRICTHPERCASRKTGDRSRREEPKLDYRMVKLSSRVRSRSESLHRRQTEDTWSSYRWNAHRCVDIRSKELRNESQTQSTDTNARCRLERRRRGRK